MAFNKIILSGNQVNDYLYIQDGEPEGFLTIDSEPSSWSDNTILFADFNNPEHPLSAGNSELIGSIDNYEVRRRKYNDSYSEYVGTIKTNSPDKIKELNSILKELNDNGLSNDSIEKIISKYPKLIGYIGDEVKLRTEIKKEITDKKFLIDYAVKNNTDYIYYLYPNIDVSKSGTALSPAITKQVSIDCPYWSLFIVDETEDDNVYYLDKMFKFELNLNIGDMSNNAQISIVQNFTKYPTIQVNNSNYWSGSLTALCGFLASNGVDYVQTPNMINELKSITSDTRKKFLKDIEGNLWEVNISAPINISSQIMSVQDIKTLNISWVEVASADGVSIIDNPNKKTFDWVITESGDALPYMTYVWGEQYIWDNTYYWTAHEGHQNTKNINLGREIKDGDV